MGENSNKKAETNRGGFGSKFGFILATTGSAVGLGNLWMFPYMAGQNGGGLFFILFLIFTVAFGLPILMGEMNLGRATKRDVVGAYRSINKKWTFVGIIEVLCPFIIMAYYSVVGGWILKYFFSYITFTDFSSHGETYFATFSSSTVEPILWHLLFISLCVVLSCIGIEKGIEKANKIMLPSLFVLIFVLAVYCMTLPNAIDGIKFLLMPDFSKFNSASNIFNILLAAMGQAFFSLSLGQGAIINYGSYLKRNNNIQKDCVLVAFFDIFVAIMSGLIILPACFAFNTPVTSGPGLIFRTLPSIFSSIPMGGILGIVFFLLVFFAAFSSAIALFEVVCTFLVDNFKIKRVYAAIIVGVSLGIVGAVVSLSMGQLNGLEIIGMNLFDLTGFLADKLLIPIGTFCMCVLISYVWKIKNFYKELEKGSDKIYFKNALTVIYKYAAPAVVFIVFIMGIISEFK